MHEGLRISNEWGYRILNTRGSLVSNSYTRSCAFHNEWVYRISNTLNLPTILKRALKKFKSLFIQNKEKEEANLGKPD